MSSGGAHLIGLLVVLRHPEDPHYGVPGTAGGQVMCPRLPTTTPEEGEAWLGLGAAQ